MKKCWLLIIALFFSLPALAFEHTHKAWDDLLKKHVSYASDGNASTVSYSGFARDRAPLEAYIDSVAQVQKTEFDAWSKAQQQAFLINAYNALTVEKILTRYPDIQSIKDFGSFVGNPWKDKFFTLFGKPASLDQIEHEILRAEGVYNEPRVHVAVVCASIGCPMLRNTAFTAEKLDLQLEDAMRRFLSDRSRNRYNAETNSLEVSRIFDWYKKDFEKGNKGYTSLEATLAKYANQLADKPEDRQAVGDRKAPIKYREYDWSLNDAKG